MTQTLRTGIIGCGKVTDLHAAALRDAPQSDFAAVCSRSGDKARAYAQRYGVKGYDNVDEMIADARLDAVVICTPHPFHAGPAIAAVRRGCHVLVEKPLAANLADCDAMIEAARTAGVTLGTVCQRRFYPPCQRIRRAIDAGKLDTPILGTVTMLGWRDEAYYRSDPWRGTWKDEGGGVLVNQAPHQLDLLLWFMGPVAELFGYWDNLNHPYIEVEDTAIATLRFAGGGLGSIVVSNSQNPALYGKVLIHGRNGASVGVQTDGGAMFVAGMSDIEEAPINDHWTVPGEEHRLAEWQQADRDLFARINAMKYFHRLQVEDFLRAVLEGREPLITGAEGRRTVELFTAIYRSQRDGRPVRFPLSPEPEDSTFDGRLARPHS